MSPKVNRSDQKRRRRQAHQATVVQLYDEYTESLAQLSQCQPEEEHESQYEELESQDKTVPLGQAGSSHANNEAEFMSDLNAGSCNENENNEGSSNENEYNELLFEGDDVNNYHEQLLKSSGINERTTSSLTECANDSGEGSVSHTVKVHVHESDNTHTILQDGSEGSVDSGESNRSDSESHETLQHSDATLPEPNSQMSYQLQPDDFSTEVWKVIIGEEESKKPEEEFKIKLAAWSTDYLVKRNALDELLKLLRNNGHPDLPACAKSLLKTPRSTKTVIKELCGGQFWYRGIRNALMSCLTAESVESLQNDTIEIDIFIDGLSPYKSVRRHVWPIAGCLRDEKTPFVIALWCGQSKEPTSVDKFFDEFVNEAEELFQNGVILFGKKLQFMIRCFNADAPARAWMRCVKGHNSYNACERCTLAGEWKFGRITYNPAHEGTLRTDESFANQIHEDHHIGLSPLLRIGTKMITQFPLDVMHLVYLGVTRRLFSLLLERKRGKFKLPANDVQKLDTLCSFLSPFCPSDFARKPRALSQWKLFKATEFRRLLLYDGFILHRNHNHHEVLECYQLLTCGMRILLDSKLRSLYISDAHDLLVRFVKKAYALLGASFVVYNVHHILHLVADCTIHGDPESFSCFKYESNLGHLKKFLVAPGRTLQQIVCRLIEQSLIPAQATSAATSSKIQLSKPHNNGPVLDFTCNQYAAATLLGSVIRVARDKPSDSVVLTSAQVVVVENIVELGSTVYIIGRPFLERIDYFNFPIPSSLLGIFKVSQLGPMQMWKIDEITQKVVYYPLTTAESEFSNFNWRESEGLCIPLLHSEN